MRLTRSRGAFTLIELMLSMALGSLIIYTLFSGFRAASQSITVSNRLSIENNLLRAGYFQVQNDLDFWVSLDDPINASNQVLRGVGSGPFGSQAGMPFTPLSIVFPGGTPPHFPAGTPLQGDPGSDLTPEIQVRSLAGAPPYGYAAGNATDPWEADVGFDPSVAYNPSDPRTWCRINLAEKAGGSSYAYPSVLFGRYGLFSNALANPSFQSWSVYNPTTNASYSVSYQQTGPTMHTWYANQVQQFLGQLGYEAMCEYLPPNAIYDYYVSASATTSPGGMPLLCTQPNWGPNGGFTNGDGSQTTARGVYRTTYATSFGYFNPWCPADPVNDSGIFNRHYMHFDSDYFANSAGGDEQHGSTGLHDLLSHTGYEQSLLPLKPSVWPAVSTCVGRLVKNDHFIAVAKIRRVDPVSGSTYELSFLGLGTSLRGARMQRNPNGGWAKWDNSPGIINDPNLDSCTSSTPP